MEKNSAGVSSATLSPSHAPASSSAPGQTLPHWGLCLLMPVLSDSTSSWICTGLGSTPRASTSQPQPPLRNLQKFWPLACTQGTPYWPNWGYDNLRLGKASLAPDILPLFSFADSDLIAAEALSNLFYRHLDNPGCKGCSGKPRMSWELEGDSIAGDDTTY